MTEAALGVSAAFPAVGLSAGLIGSVLWIAGGAKEDRALGRGIGLTAGGLVGGF